MKIWATSKVKGSEWKSNLAYARAMNPEVLNMQRFWSHHLPIRSFLITNVFFFLILTWFFKFCCFSEYHSHIFDKNKFDFPNQNLILNWFVCHFLFFFIFSGKFRAAENSTPGTSKAEKWIGWGKKKKKIAITSRGTVFRTDTKNVISIYSGTGDVSQGLCLSTFKKNLHLWKPGAYW